MTSESKTEKDGKALTVGVGVAYGLMGALMIHT